MTWFTLIFCTLQACVSLKLSADYAAARDRFALAIGLLIAIANAAIAESAWRQVIR